MSIKSIKCQSNVNQMSIKCQSNVNQKSSKIINVKIIKCQNDQMSINCLLNVYQMSIKCLLNVYSSDVGVGSESASAHGSDQRHAGVRPFERRPRGAQPAGRYANDRKSGQAGLRLLRRR